MYFYIYDNTFIPEIFLCLEHLKKLNYIAKNQDLSENFILSIIPQNPHRQNSRMLRKDQRFSRYLLCLHFGL